MLSQKRFDFGVLILVLESVDVSNRGFVVNVSLPTNFFLSNRMEARKFFRIAKNKHRIYFLVFVDKS